MLRYLMSDSEWVEFLQWALPRMRMQWPGFRKVRRQVCRRIAARIGELRLSGIPQYRTYLADHREEWKVLDSFCRITISRFYRDRYLFQFLESVVLPKLAQGTGRLRCWSCGCASGEEPYTLSIIWQERLKTSFPETDIEIIGTDSMDTMLDRARSGLYGGGSLRELPEYLVRAGFVIHGNRYEVKEGYRRPVRFLRQDVRDEMPEGPFHLILCRYLVFTYFEERLQEELVEKFLARLAPGGALVLGRKERLPFITDGLEPWPQQECVYRKSR